MLADFDRIEWICFRYSYDNTTPSDNVWFGKLDGTNVILRDSYGTCDPANNDPDGGVGTADNDNYYDVILEKWGGSSAGTHNVYTMQARRLSSSPDSKDFKQDPCGDNWVNIMAVVKYSNQTVVEHYANLMPDIYGLCSALAKKVGKTILMTVVVMYAY
jgi:hypothetical protein